MRRTLAAVVVVMALSGCHSTAVTQMPEIDVPVPRPRPVTWLPVEMTRETEDRYVMNRRSRNNLVSNLADIRRYITQQNALVDYHETKSR